MGIVRSSFLIDEQGVIEKASFKVKPIPTQRSCWVSKKCVSVVISGDERTSPDMHQDTLHAGKRGCGKCRSLRLHWGSLVMALSILLEENIFTIVPAFLGSMLVNPGVKAKLFCPEIAGLFCRIAGLFCHDSRANLSLKPVCFGIAIS